MEIQNNQTHNQLWSYHNFPNPSYATEDILVIVREDLSKVINHLNGSFYILVGVLLLRNITVNGFTNPTLVYFTDAITYGFLCYLMLRIAYFFHNYFLSFYAITSCRIIKHTQENLVSSELSQIWFQDIKKIEVSYVTDPQKIANHTTAILIYTGDKEIIRLENIPKPEEITLLIQQIIVKNL